ncbi:MAG TPA: DNA-processing protein DprA [Thermoanaerobaculia bacterium]
MFEWFEQPCDACNASSNLLQGLLNIDEVQAAEVKNPLQDRRYETLRDSVITLFDPDYPPLLKEIIDPPLALHVRGDRSLLQRHAIAIVGSRRASPYAVNAAKHLATPLASEAMLVIVSGLARGVDAAAHEAALDADGTTIAVLGTGIDIVYPKSNRALFRRIENEGLIVSEFAPGTPPHAMNFPIRNRIISGLSLGTVIVEATGRSGSLITARTAAEQGREVFAVPGSIFSKGTEGTHRLIQYGAKLVHDANDVVEEIEGLGRLAKKPDPQPPEPLRDVLDALSRDDALHVDAAAAKLGRGVPAIAESLLQLELGGWVRSLPGSRYVRVR